MHMRRGTMFSNAKGAAVAAAAVSMMAKVSGMDWDARLMMDVAPGAMV